MCAFIGGAWFILTKVIFGPFSRMFEHDLFIADLDRQIIIKEYSGRVAPDSKQAKTTRGVLE